jgi:hypothetical protein
MAISLGLLTSSHAQDGSMNSLAEQYVRLVLAVGQHDADYVDAYYGPPEWRKEAEARKLPLTEIVSRAAALSRDLAVASQTPAGDEMAQLRRHYLTRQLDALRARVSMLTGTKLRFDEESKALYDATAPTHTEADFADVLTQLQSKLPGTDHSSTATTRSAAVSSSRASGSTRYSKPRSTAAAAGRCSTSRCRPVKASRSSTSQGKSWSGYNWYQGDYRSLIQVNTDLPIYVDRAIDLACHEGYPGHHVYNVLLEKNLLRDRGWIEFSVYPLFSPQSLIAEGTANYGIEIAFPRAERLQFERRVLFPAAGLNPEHAAQYYDVMALVDKLSYAGNERHGAISMETSTQRRRPIGSRNTDSIRGCVRNNVCASSTSTRSYVINYNLGKDMVAAYIESRGPDRWAEFARLISSPRLPSSLTVKR